MTKQLTELIGRNIPEEYGPFVEPAKRIGEKLGDLIADGWDALVDKLLGD